MIANIMNTGSQLRSFWDARLKGVRQSGSIRSVLGTIFSALSRLTFGLMVVAMPFRYRFRLAARPMPPIFGDYTDFLVFGSEILLAATLAFWVLDLALRPRRFGWGPWWLTAPLAGIVATSAASIFSSIDPALSAFHSIRNAFLFGLYIFTINEIKTINWLCAAVVIQVYIQSAVGLGQVIRQESVGLQRWGELLLDADWTGVSIVWAEGARSLRAYGLSDHPNILGGSLALGILLAAAWYPTVSRRWQAPVAAGFGLGVIGLFLTFSRAAWLAAAGGLLTSAAYFWRHRNRNDPERALAGPWLSLMISAAVLTIPLVWLNIPLVNVRLNTNDSFTEAFTEEKSIFERGVLSESANQIFASRPLTGVGFGTFPQALLKIEPDLRFDYQPAHVALLDAAAETGIFGALAYSLALAAPLAALAAKWRGGGFSIGLMAASAALIGLTIIGMFDYYTWLLVPGRLWQWLIWGLWAGMYTRND